MCHTTCTKGNQGDSRLLVVESQIANLIINPSFGHNLCLNTQMGHAILFQTSMFQDLSNDIDNSSIQWVLSPEISL
jgi:hypothetical protein